MTHDNLRTTGPAWDLTAEYASITDPKINQEVSKIQELIAAIETASIPLTRFVQTKGQDPLARSEDCLAAAGHMATLRYDVLVLISNLRTYAHCLLSVDGKMDAAKKLQSQIQSLHAQAQEAQQAFQSWVMIAPDQDIADYLKLNPITETETFQIQRKRLLHKQRLSLEEEQLLISMEVHGLTAWGNLYSDIATSLTCTIDKDGKTESMGLARANNLLTHHESAVRESAYRSINRAWLSAEESCGAVMNNLAGWRLDVYKRRSHHEKVHFLDSPAHINAVHRQTIDAMMSAIATVGRPLGQAAIKTMSQTLKLPHYGPWDRFAPLPNKGKETSYSFEEAIQIIEEAFATVSPEMSDFVRTMVKNRWIEGTVGDAKRPGAYCTKFLKSRTPRVYMTYTGSMSDIITLAHELGHAFHNWVMQDLPLSQIAYPMTLAETASIFAQTVVNDALHAKAKNITDIKPVLWTDAQEIETFLLDIPMRYSFEKSFYESRATNMVPVAQIKELLKKSWLDWYGNSMSEVNEMFWASKLHFHISSLSFYNFPYSFGYLFSLGVLNRREAMGQDFYPAYVNLLRDTGRMTAEDLARKHLDVNLRDQTFWQESLVVVQQKLKLIQEIFA